MPHPLTNFSLPDYSRLLDQLRWADYQPLDFPAAANLTPAAFQQPHLLLRHDIDFTVQAARAMAEVESSKGLFATYFFLLRTPFYNLFTAENTRDIRVILSLGHKLGLHFDRMAYPADASVADLAAACSREAALLSDYFSTPIEVISYHRPIAREIEGRAEGSHPLLNTYMEVFTKRITYISDSQGAFRFGHPLDSEAFQKRAPIQLLIHPIWWGDEAASPLNRLQQFAAARAETTEQDMAKNCKVFRVGRWAHIKDE